MKKIGFVLCVLFLISGTLPGQDTYPHILVNPSDKQEVLSKINQQDWAKSIFEGMKSRLEPYVIRHQSDPEWILSRYLMNRIPGKYYTDFYCDRPGTQLIGYSGNAPVPTVRVTTHKRNPISKGGYGFRVPEIEELTPYDTARLMYLQTRSPSGEWEWTDPQLIIGSVNAKINMLALESAILYWLTGEEKYAEFASDILFQWARGASYQNPIHGACRAGFLCIQTLGDGRSESLILAYDFVRDFMQKKYDTKYFEPVFEKIVQTMAFRGYWNNNWYAAQTSTLVYAALSLEDQNKRKEYLQYVLEKDTINSECGRYCLASTVEKWLTEDGHWKEPGGYHNYPVTHLLTASFALEKNGYQIFNKYPALFDASYVMLKYAFPNLQGSSFGDTGRPRQSAECLEIGINMAQKYDRKELSPLLSAMSVLISEKQYQREESGYMGLLCFVPEIPESNIPYTWPRSGKLDFARFYLQRNGTGPKHGLMYAVQGATYNHNHANGMAMELYGMGQVMGVDPGNGLSYEDPMHVNYYAQWAAHNTVVAGARSASVPYFTGGGGTKRIGEIELAAMEPLAGEEPVSPYCSFTDTWYYEASTKTNQQRTLAIIRTSKTSGYYLDIYRSDHKENNQYLYHNIGDAVKLSDFKDQKINTGAIDFPLAKNDPPGFRIMSGYQSTGIRDGNTKALFTVSKGANPGYMQVLMTGNSEREWMTAMAPISKTADPPYNNLPTPVLLCYQHGEAWEKPFVAVYEPFGDENGYSVRSIEQLNTNETGTFTELHAEHADGSKQIIYQSVDPAKKHHSDGVDFQGSFGVVSLRNDDFEYIYLGHGTEISIGKYSLKPVQPGAVCLAFKDGAYTISCNQETEILFFGTFKKVELIQGDKKKKKLPDVKHYMGTTTFKIPECRNAKINLIK